MVLASTIAIVESSASDRHRYRQYLNADRLLEVSSSGEGLELCVRHQPEAVLLGDSIGDALEFLDRLHATVSPPPAVVFVVSRSREALAARAFKAGVRDYLIREDITPETLRHSIETAIASVRPNIECDRVTAEAVLRESEERFRTLAENISQLAWMADPTGWILWYNQRWYDYTGTTFEQMQGWGWQQVHHPDYVDGVVDRFRHCIEAGQPWEDTFPLRGTDGRYRWFLSRALPIRDDRGDISCWFGTNTDITDLKEAEDAIANSEERLRLAAEGAQMGTWDIDLATGEAVWSPRHFTILGYEPHPQGIATEQMWHDRLYREDVDRVTREWLQARQERRRYRAEYRIVRADNQQISWVVALGSFTYNSRGEAIRSTGVVLDINPRKQAETALMRQERRYRHIFEAVGVSIWEEDFSQVKAAIDELKAAGVDDIGEYCRSHPQFVRDAIAMVGLRDVNPASLHLFEAQTKEELLHSLDRIFTPETEETFIEELVAIAAGETRFAAETVLQTLAGDRLDVLFSIAFPPPDEPYDRVLVSTIDISDRVAAEAALRESESRFRQMANTAPMLVWMSGTDKRCNYFNQSWLTFTGQTMAQELGDGWTQGIHPEDFDRTVDTYITAFDARRPFEMEYRLRNASGDYRWIFDAGAPRFTPDGEFLGYIGSCFDIHQRKQTERALRRSEDRLRMTIEAARLGTWDWNLRTNVLIWDAGCKAMFGLSPEANISIEVFFEGLHPDDRDRLDKIIQEVLNPTSGGNYDTEYRTIGIEDGIERWVSAKGQVYFDTDGIAQRFIGTVLDISDRKQAEAERERLLESERAARSEAERANRVKDEFLAILSHELRSPLNPILGWSKLLQMREFNREQIISAAATIERNVKLQTQLVDDLLDLARILRGKLSLDPAPVDLVQVVEAAMETVKTAAVSKAIALYSTLPQVGQVFGDPARLQQVVWNLLSNAIKFTSKGGRVDVQLEENDDRVRILVSDTGKGIKREFLPYLFEAFRQESAATTRKHGGLGLGLAIVEQLVEAHGGTIWADSPGEDMGATFTVELPLFDTAANGARSRGLHPQEIDLSGIRILAVDDSSDACELLKILLGEYGAEVTAVTSAAEAIATFETLQPDVLISDIGMPEVDGYTLIQKIRALVPERGGNIPAIALTAYAREDDRDRAIEWGYQCHIPKPLDPDRLVDAIVELIQ